MKLASWLVRLAPLFWVVSGFFGSGLMIGCSSNSSDPSLKPEAVELVDSTRPTLDTPELELFQNAKSYYQVGLYSQALEAFQTLRDGYPLGPFTEFAEIKMADASFEGGEYAKAAQLYEEILQNHPGSSASPYILLRGAQSYQLAQKGLGRDITPLKKSLELYAQLTSRFPQSIYAESARSLEQEARATLAAQEKLVIDFYRKMDKPEAVAARDQEFAGKWGKKSGEFQAASPSEPSTQIALMKANVPSVSSPTIVDISRIKKKGEKGSGVEMVSKSISTPDPFLAKRITLHGAECRGDLKLVFLHISAPVGSELISQQGSIESSHGEFRLSLPRLTTSNQKPFVFDCFGKQDLNLSPTGDLVLKTAGKEIELTSLDNPPRILLAVH